MLTEQLVMLGRSLRGAGLVVDAGRMAMAVQALGLVALDRLEDVRDALEAVFVSRQEDRDVFLQVLEAHWQRWTHVNPSEGLPSFADDNAAPKHRRAQQSRNTALLPHDDERAPMLALNASDFKRLRQADFLSLSADEFLQLQHHVKAMRLEMPKVKSRRWCRSERGSRVDWSRLMRSAARHGGEVVHVPRQRRREQPLPLLVLLDVSGSMAPYARMLLAFLHQRTSQGSRTVFTFGTDLTDLRSAFALRDPDAMLQSVNLAVSDFGGGTRLGASLATLRQRYARTLTARRSVVLLITDGLDTGEPDALRHEMQWLKHHARHVLWLNPLLRFDGYAPLARGPKVLSECCDAQVAIHNLDRLSSFAHGLQQLLKT
ncbi:VWA domain-containing protein [Limnohabitans sp. B9-3]|uniref:vWA domain-containing protein n=1 Tax=Limnohabitans sp. B9-3 TaxID=1100707 RepID=UPI000C1F3A5A|nr:VWA domain-containing protein [Limnohabitans sp. B9-3]PIT73742.1 hypothetical protein B9Z42_11085 [Limnohabitans sp. B9-3]